MAVLVGGAGPFVAQGDDCVLYSEFRPTGHGTLTADALISQDLVANLTGVGSVAPTLNEVSAAALAVTGVGALTAALTQVLAMNLATQGAGSLAPTLAETFAMAVVLTGRGALTPELAQTYALLATLLGVGSLTPSLQAFSQTMLATMQGRGSLTIASLAGDYTLTVTATGRGTPQLELTGAWTAELLISAAGFLRVALRKTDDDIPATPPGAAPTGGIWTIISA